ncbi:MAG: hypothetical protein U1D67_05660 [Dehalococcoidia bacterium]|nr:hypothetical protein [Dehalococcoidia bacterium]MDZ4246590.1 hypothetical protein [Dehalococcoidia bacterium]
MLMVRHILNGTLPWKSRLPEKAGDNHPGSLEEFKALEPMDGVARVHIKYLEECGRQFYRYWLPTWDEVMAVGPFQGRLRKYKSIPVIIVNQYKRPYRHVVALSEALNEPYRKFGILPVLYFLSRQEMKALEETKAREWEMTRKVSIHWKKK